MSCKRHSSRSTTRKRGNRVRLCWEVDKHERYWKTSIHVQYCPTYRNSKTPYNPTIRSRIDTNGCACHYIYVHRYKPSTVVRKYLSSCSTIGQYCPQLPTHIMRVCYGELRLLFVALKSFHRTTWRVVHPSTPCASHHWHPTCLRERLRTGHACNVCHECARRVQCDCYGRGVEWLFLAICLVRRYRFLCTVRLYPSSDHQWTQSHYPEVFRNVLFDAWLGNGQSEFTGSQCPFFWLRVRTWKATVRGNDAETRS